MVTHPWSQANPNFPGPKRLDTKGSNGKVSLPTANPNFPGPKRLNPKGSNGHRIPGPS